VGKITAIDRKRPKLMINTFHCEGVLQYNNANCHFPYVNKFCFYHRNVVCMIIIYSAIFVNFQLLCVQMRG
jgi:hypothetical protein